MKEYFASYRDTSPGSFLGLFRHSNHEFFENDEPAIAFFKSAYKDDLLKIFVDSPTILDSFWIQIYSSDNQLIPQITENDGKRIYRASIHSVGYIPKRKLSYKATVIVGEPYFVETDEQAIIFFREKYQDELAIVYREDGDDMMEGLVIIYSDAPLFYRRWDWNLRKPIDVSDNAELYKR